MPPSLPQDSDNILVNSPEPYYTNEDVAILHDIVVRAEALLPSLPERERVPTNALFNAYYSILPSIGVDADHDSRYARVLFKIGGTRIEGSLYDKFEAVLSRMGIEIQFDPQNDEEGEGEGPTTESTTYKGSDTPAYPGSGQAVAKKERGRSRSNSEGPELASGAKYDGPEALRPRASSSDASTVHSTDIATQLNNAVGLLNTTSRVSGQTLQSAQSRDGAGKQEKNYDLRAWLSDSLGNHPQINRTRSASAHGSLRIRRKLPAANDYDVMTTSTSRSPLGDGVAAGPTYRFLGADQEHLYLPKEFAPISEDLLNTKVSLLEQFRRENLLRRILTRWQQKALQLREDNANLELLAKHRDRQVLLRQALDSWHITLEERRQRAETEHFFAHLERRAGRARDLFTTAKAFSHWAYNASQETQRTTVARRHVLRTRYFGVWRDLTAINELKVRRQVLRKFFPLWHKQYIATSLNTERAAFYFTGNLVRRIFWAWFWAFCEGRAPVWRNDKLLGKQMAIWILVTKQRHNEDKRALAYYQHTIRRKICFVWSIKTYEYATRRRQAYDYRNVYLCRKTLREWQHGAALLAPLQSLRDRVESRLKRGSLKLWVSRARNESHARAVDRFKILREAWVTWNNRMRSQALQAKITDRVALQSIYKWVLDGRLRVDRRKKNIKMKQTSIWKMVEAFQISKVKDSSDLRLAEESFNHKLGTRAIRRWRACLQTQFKHQRLALEFGSPKVLTDLLHIWSRRSREIHQLKAWAHDGQFYFLASKTLRLWKDATEKVKREKRRLVYTQFRRSYKLSLATRTLSKWRQQANAVIQIDRQAVEVYHNKSVVICIEAFDQWRARIEEIAELDLMHGQSLLKKCLNEMKSTQLSRRDLEMEATAFFEDRATTSCMKKWSRIHLQLRARQHVVFEVREKRIKKTSRRILAHWRQRAFQKQDLGVRGSMERSNSSFREKAAPWTQLGDDRIVDDWADGNDEAAISTTIPGYLSTPSKKMSRVNTMTKLPSTTPSAPLSTPVERQLREQYSGGVLPSFRRRIGRSLLGREGTPLDLDEESKTRDGEVDVE